MGGKLDTFLQSLAGSGLSMWIDRAGWFYPGILIVHGLGMCVMAGLTCMIGLRLFGFPRQIPMVVYEETLPWLIGAFLINAASGLLLFIHDAYQLFHNVAYDLKMISLFIGLGVTWLLYRDVLGPAAALEATGASYVAGRRDKAVGLAAVAIWWFAVIASGRFIAYLTPPPT